MNRKNLTIGSSIAAGIVAVIICVGMVTGFSVAQPFISVDPVSAKTIGDRFAVTGNTSLPAGSEILVDIHPAALDMNTGMIIDPATGAARRLVPSEVSTGMLTVDTPPGGTAAWSYSVDTTGFRAGEYVVNTLTMAGNKTHFYGTTEFTMKQGSAATGANAPGPGSFISVDPIGDKNAGDRFTITGTTSLPAGKELQVEVYAASFESYTGDTGEFSGAVGGVDVVAGNGGINTWSMDLDTATFLPREYLVNVTVFTGDVSRGDFSTTGPIGKTTFTVHPAKETTGTKLQPNPAGVNGILIDPIKDTPAGKILEVSGTTSLPAGTYLGVVVVPVRVENGRLTGDYGHLENAAVTRVFQGSGTANRFSASLDTRLLPAADHIVTVFAAKDAAAGIISPGPGAPNGTAVFNILAGNTGTGRPESNTSVPCIYINPVSDVAAGETFVASGTTSVPVGSELQVMVISESSTDYQHPEIAATISAAKGSLSNNLISVTLATKDLPRGNHVLIISAEDYEVTGSSLFTVK